MGKTQLIQFANKNILPKLISENPAPQKKRKGETIDINV